ncbi:MAG: OmpA family protein [Bryobacteraceae bacterium]
MLKQLGAVGAVGVFASCLFAQGLNTSQTKDQWEEINFEFNSSILSDGYPSLLRLAEILGQHHDYHVKLTGNTDYVGSARYNDRLAMRRAETVRDFLVKYGAAADQISTAGDGKKAPEVDNKTKEGRFMNRRVVMTVTDGQGKVVAAGGASDIMPILQELLKKQEECCNNILKRLDKLDDILAALRDLKGENDRLKGQVADLQNQEKALEAQVNGMPKPLSKDETTAIAEKAGNDALNEAQNRNKKFSLLGLDIGPTLGNRPDGDVTIQGRGQFFSPFGGDGTHAVQAEAEYLRYPGRQEGQFDIGLVNRWDHLQAGLFSSFKYIRLGEYENGGSMGQGAFLLDYLFSRGRIGFYGTEGFKNTGALTETPLGLTSFIETYARPMNQFGLSTQVGVWGDAWIQGNFGYIHSHSTNPNRPGGEIKLVQPLSKEFAVTVRAGLNPTLLTASNTGELTFGLEFGNFMRPKEYTTFTHPVPMDVPRIRYELLTRQVGHSAPIANAGPAQIGVPPGTITLNGSGSYSPDHDALNYSWTQVSGPSVPISGANSAIATFTAAGSTSYGFSLTVTDQLTGLTGSANTTVTTQRALSVVRFSATPSNIASGQSSTLAWNVPNATSVNISGVGSGLNPAGTATVSPTTTTTYNLTATGQGGQTITASVTVTVGASNPKIIRFAASPVHISQGQSSLLSWTTTGASTVSISNSVGSVAANGSVSVSPATTTTYTLTATGADGKTSVTAAVTVTVGGGAVPSIISFTVSPPVIAAGGQASLCWNVSNSTSVSIAPGIGNEPATGCTTVTPSVTTTYVLTATNAVGPNQAVVTVSVGPVQILSFSASSSAACTPVCEPGFSPYPGAPVVLQWTTSNATSVIITGTGAPGGNQPTNGSVTVNPGTDTTYTLTAYGPGGPVSNVINVHVR